MFPASSNFSAMTPSRNPRLPCSAKHHDERPHGRSGGGLSLGKTLCHRPRGFDGHSNRCTKSGALLANNLHQRALPSGTVKFSVKNLFPETKVELPLGDRNYHFSVHDLPLHMRVGI